MIFISTYKKAYILSRIFNFYLKYFYDMNNNEIKISILSKIYINICYQFQIYLYQDQLYQFCLYI